MFTENKNLIPKDSVDFNGYIYMDYKYTDDKEELKKHPYVIEIIFGCESNIPEEFDCVFIHFNDHAIQETTFEILKIEDLTEKQIIEGYERNLSVRISATKEVKEIIERYGHFTCSVFILRIAPNVNITVKPTIFCDVQ